MKRLMLVFLMMLAPLSAQALDVFACEPEWGSLVREMAGDDITVTVATSAFQDPHRLQARPSLIAAVRNADLVVCTGADLEVGWLPLLLRRAGNPDVQPGRPGLFLAADFVRKLEVPQTIDRAQGDVHPQGNPHVHLHPRNIARVADALSERLSIIDPRTSLYTARDSKHSRPAGRRPVMPGRCGPMPCEACASRHTTRVSATLPTGWTWTSSPRSSRSPAYHRAAPNSPLCWKH